MTFAVIDFETTGLMPERNDRVIEAGVVLVDSEGKVEQEWTTLVNPHRDVGSTHIHRLCAGDLLDAPEFADVADQILSFLAGRTVVAHNATFDMKFLRTELERSGYAISGNPLALCSMKWSGRLVGPAKLQHACEALGVELGTDAHSAMADARATAGLLAHLIRLARQDREWLEDVESSRRYGWPPLQGRSRARVVARGERKPDLRSWLDSVLSTAWIPGAPEDEASYLLALDRALLDRNISISEARQLVDAARNAGLSGASVARIHRSYLMSVAHEALVDGVVTDTEKTDLIAIARALGLASSDVDEALASAAGAQSKRKSVGLFSLSAGDRVVFTGETSHPREAWVNEILASGLMSGGITKSTKLIVAADPDSLSGKAVKARAYGVPIVDEKAFTRLFQEYLARR